MRKHENKILACTKDEPTDSQLPPVKDSDNSKPVYNMWSQKSCPENHSLS